MSLSRRCRFHSGGRGRGRRRSRRENEGDGREEGSPLWGRRGIILNFVLQA